MFLYEKKDKTRCSLGLFIGIISFLVLSRTSADLQARERQETTKTIPNSNTPRKTTTASSSSKKEEDINQNWLAARSLIFQAGNCLVKLITMSSPKMWEV